MKQDIARTARRTLNTAPLRHGHILAVALAGIVATTSGCAHFERPLYPPGPVVEGHFDCRSDNLKGAEAEAYKEAESISAAVGELTKTRNAYGAFLRCREDVQLVTGAGVVGLTGGALGLAAAGIKPVTAAALGAAAGTGLGINYVLYNKEKTKAYATAVTQLQCAIEKGKAAERWIGDDLADRHGALVDVLREAVPSRTECKGNRQWAAIWARQALLQSRIAGSGTKISKSLTQSVVKELLAVGRLIDAQAFAAAQGGVPDGERIKAAVESVALPIPAGAPANELMGTGDGETDKSASAANACAATAEALQAASAALDTIEAEIKRLLEADYGISACLGQTSAGDEKAG